MWLGVIIIIICVIFIGYMVICKPERLDALDKVLSPEVEDVVTGFSGPSVKRKREEPECVIPDDGPDDLSCPKPREGGTKFKNEERCRAILERIYEGYKFPSVRPSWLKNPATKRNLEIDMYCHELKIKGRDKPVRLGLEFNGKQHYQKTKFHKNRSELVYQYRRDEWKKHKCKKLGVHLITVPYYIRPEELENFIRGELYKLGLLEKK